MSMSYRFWPSTMATRSSSACVALMSIRFIVHSSCAYLPTPGGEGHCTERLGRFASGYRKRAAASCACRAAVEFSSAATPRRTAGALIPFHMLRGRRPPPDSRRRGRVARGVVQRGQSRHGADDGRICRAAVNMSTPRVVANVTAAGLVRQAGFRPDEQLTARHFLRNQTLASPPECIRSVPNDTARFPPQCGCPHRSHPR